VKLQRDTSQRTRKSSQETLSTPRWIDCGRRHHHLHSLAQVTERSPIVSRKTPTHSASVWSSESRLILNDQNLGDSSLRFCDYYIVASRASSNVICAARSGQTSHRNDAFSSHKYAMVSYLSIFFDARAGEYKTNTLNGHPSGVEDEI